MSYFIDRIAEYIYEEELSLEHLTIILPSQRAKKYLQRALFNSYEKPIFSPEIVTMNRWVQDLSPLPVIDPTRALFKLYDVHLTVDKEETQSLDEFLNWGKTLLSDFDEMDRYLINSKDLFKNLADIKEIENWSFNTEEELTEGQKRFMRFWDLLPEYYKVFNERLRQDGECYMGQTYKSLAHHIDRVFEKDEQRHFIFAGFNALSPAEKSIIKQLDKMGRASIFIDADPYYLNNKDHEAGLFLRDLMNRLNTQSLPFTENRLATESKAIKIINCAQRTGQAQVSATLLHQTIPSNELSETLLVLADESMIVPVIKNIPASVEKTNITLGLPLKNTAIRSWVDLLFSVQEHHRHFQTQAVYHKDFIRFIKHPFIVSISSLADKDTFQKIERHILENNWLFISLKKLNLSPLLDKIATQFFEKWSLQNATNTLAIIRSINRLIFDQIDPEKDTIEKAILFHFDNALRQLDNIFEEFQPSLNLGTFKKLFNQHWINATIAYYGNPLEGLQVMGVLETRLLDFKNVIIVGLNDGSMPPTNAIQTFVPMDLRQHRGLPTPREKQGLFAHHFYRLLHAAERVWITYSTAEGNMGVDEPSRYIQQVELELARINPNINLTREDYTLTNEEEQSDPLIIQKSPELLERIRTYLKKGTSASAIKTHLNCSLDFYYKYLLGFGEEGEVEEEIEASSFGSFIHDTLESIYTPFARMKKNKQGEIVSTRAGKNMVHSDVQKMISQFKPVLQRFFEAHFSYNKKAVLDGKNYLSLEVAEHLVRRFLEHECELLKASKNDLTIDGLEIRLTTTLEYMIGAKSQAVKLVGIIDRIDQFNGEQRIIDYKSGTCSEKDVRVDSFPRTKELDDCERLIKNIKEKKYVFQLLLYNLMFHDHFGYYPDKVGVISMVNLKEGPFYLSNNLTADTDSLMELFHESMVHIVSKMLDENVTIEHNVEAPYCEYCQ